MSDERQKNRQLALLKVEVDLDFEGLVPALESGVKFILFTADKLAENLSADGLRRMGGMVALCRHYGAALTFAWGDHLIDLEDSKSRAQP